MPWRADNNENEENGKSGSGARSKPNTSAKESLNDRVSNSDDARSDDASSDDASNEDSEDPLSNLTSVLDRSPHERQELFERQSAERLRQ